MILWLALLFSLLTATSHATHFKGGTVTWIRDTTAPSGEFHIDAQVYVNFDMSSGALTVDPSVPEVKGIPIFEPGMAVNAAVALDWGDGSERPILNNFVVVAADFGALIVTLKATQTDKLKKEYLTEGAFTMALIGGDRENEEGLANRQDTVMRVESSVLVDFEEPTPGHVPPAFDPASSNLRLIDRSSGPGVTATLEAPTIPVTYPHLIKYSFPETEGETTDDEGSQLSWERANGLSINEATGVISWDTHAIDQSILTYAIQVVATAYLTGAPNDPPLSKTTIEFQVWVDDPNQDGEPVMEMFPKLTTLTAVAGEAFQFRVYGTDRDGQVYENSRLDVAYAPNSLPTGAVFVPSGGYAGLDHQGLNPEKMEAIFWWTPQANQVGTHTFDLWLKDDDDHTSDVVSITINVVGTNPNAQAPTLTVTPATVEGDDFVVVTPPDEEMSLTLTAACATAGVDMAIYSEEGLPAGFTLTPALPVGTSPGTAHGVLTWTPTNVTPANQPLELTLMVGDEFGREISSTVKIHVRPRIPTISLAPGEPATIESAVWQTMSFDFTVAGGFSGNGNLTVELMDGVGSVPSTALQSGSTTTFTWRILPGQLPGNVLRIKVTDFTGQTAILEVPVAIDPPAPPQWWEDSNVLTGTAAENYGMAVQGQLKSIATKAYAALLAEHPDLATATPEGTALAGYVGGFNTTEGNYAAVTQGQVKRAAYLFYRTLFVLSGEPDFGMPWTANATDDELNAPVSVGQIKTLFSFPLPAGAIFNDSPSAAITSPTPDQEIMDRFSYTIAVNASDADGEIAQVEFFINDVSVGIDTSEPYQKLVENLVVGNYNLKAVARDNDGAETITAVVPIEVIPWVNSPPNAQLVGSIAGVEFPTFGQTYPSGTHITVTAHPWDAEDTIQSNNITKIEFYDGTTLLGTDTTHPYEFVWGPAIQAKFYDMKAKIYDRDGGIGDAYGMSFTISPLAPNTTATMSFQNGTNGYSKMVDTYVSANQGDEGTNYAGLSTLKMDNQPKQAALLKWDLGDVPANAPNFKVVEARFTFTVADTSGRQFQLYRMLREWNVLEANWTQATSTVQWGGGSQGISADNGDREGDDSNSQTGMLGEVEGDVAGETLTVVLTGANAAKIQEWITNPGTNKGITILNFSNQVFPNQPLWIHSADSSTVVNRPKLTIDYDFTGP